MIPLFSLSLHFFDPKFQIYLFWIHSSIKFFTTKGWTTSYKNSFYIMVAQIMQSAIAWNPPCIPPWSWFYYISGVTIGLLWWNALLTEEHFFFTLMTSTPLIQRKSSNHITPIHIHWNNSPRKMHNGSPAKPSNITHIPTNVVSGLYLHWLSVPYIPTLIWTR